MPNWSAAAATRALTWSWSLTSVTCAIPPISAAVLAAVSAFLSATITLAPSSRSFSRDGPADALARAGDDRDTTLEFHLHPS